MSGARIIPTLRTMRWFRPALPLFAAATAFTFASLSAGAQAAPAHGPAANSAINIPFETYKLPNGLMVILSQDRTVPRVAVDVWYHVGSKNEITDHTGFAHLFEHVMFTGSGHAPYPLHDRLTGGVGGSNNGSTTQ